MADVKKKSVSFNSGKGIAKCWLCPWVNNEIGLKVIEPAHATFIEYC